MAQITQPGKFQGESFLTVYAYSLSMNGDGEVYSNEGLGESSTIIDGPFDPDNDWDEHDEQLDPEEMAIALASVGCVVDVDSQGFVVAEFYQTQEEFAAMKLRVIEMYAGDDDAGDESLTEVSIPSEYLLLASKWYNGQSDMLYAVSSTGDLTLGSARPSSRVNHAWRWLTDREWHLSLWVALSSDIAAAARACEKSAHGPDHDDAAELRGFEQFTDETIERLRAAYGLQNSEVV